MDLATAPVLDVRASLPRERQDLLLLIASLTDEQWLAMSWVPGWTVKDLALHILDDDLGWLSRGRDGDGSGRLAVDDAGAFVDALNAKNQRWIDSAQQLSRPVVMGLLEWSGHQMDDYYASQDLHGVGSVSWASDQGVPVWFDIAQDLTERWVHQMQMREAVGMVETYRDDYLPVVMRTFVWAVPHQFRAPADSGARIRLDLTSGGAWDLTSDGTGRWALDPHVGGDDACVAMIRFDDDAGWRWLTGEVLISTASSARVPPDCWTRS